jgi:hypothetical protein
MDENRFPKILLNSKLEGCRDEEISKTRLKD